MQEFGQDLLVALFCVGVGGMDATGSACRVLVGIKLKSRKDILLDEKVQYLLRRCPPSFVICYPFVFLLVLVRV